MSDERAPLSVDELQAIRERCAAAAPGPWGMGIYGDEMLFAVMRPDAPPWAEQLCVLLRRADAEFIAHARADIPALLAEAERLRALLARRGGDNGIIAGG